MIVSRFPRSALTRLDGFLTGSNVLEKCPTFFTTESAQKELKLLKKEPEDAELALTTFGETVHLAERNRDTHQNWPKSSYFPSLVIKAVLDQLLAVDSVATLKATISSWIFCSGHIESLYVMVQKLQIRQQGRNPAVD
ncbi:hypothetical protein B0H10DRAFT_1944777 [Mycena sp. CBHHK59/15]|nr:hypothetical protein B0H10DRAFT_1944777 [Mycena sp. CBHHK59/15]